MSLFLCRKSIGRLSAIYAFWWNWIWATTIWRTFNPKLLRVTRDCRRWRYPITKLPPCRPTSSPISSTWKASIWATITSKTSSGTHLKTWATQWNRLMWTIIVWVLCVRKFSFRWRTSSRFRWVNIDGQNLVRKYVGFWPPASSQHHVLFTVISFHLYSLQTN